ncbi:MAG: translation initiation factor IF-2 [Planctomycetota bacterium]|jgi:translation initiation factor IF-2
MATTRVYILAKELGVDSSAIVKKCHDESIDVKNHMSTISAGLAATIREWFSEGMNITTVETAEKVDLKKVRKTKKKKKAVTKKKKKKKKVTAKKEPPLEEEVAEKTETTVDKAKTKKTKKKVKAKKKTTKKKKAKPEIIIPAGPILEKPEPAKLSGPTVVRVEKPEPLKRPKPKPRRRYDEPITEPLISDKDQIDLPFGDKGKKRAPRVGKKIHPRRKSEHEQIPAPPKGKWRQRDIEERQARLEAAGGKGLRARPTRKIATKSKSAAESAVHIKPEKVSIAEPITVKDLSAALAVKASDIITKLMQQGVMATANQAISTDMAELVALEFGTELIVEQRENVQEQIEAGFQQRSRDNLSKRSVVATMLGHVDHGKTSLLDKIRSTHVTADESGGITQHIGAYQVSWLDKNVTFLDTPGHEAFTAMRARGANMTDVVVLVIAVDDGVMPQTVEAIHHAKAADVPVIVALNKIDLPGADENRVYSQLAEHELTPVEWGGETNVVKTSAVTGEGIDDLLEHLDYVAELMELQADDSIPATGWIVEAKMSPTRGPVATILIKEGIIKKSDIVLAGQAFGRVKTLINSYGKKVDKATSSMPVEITGLNDVPRAGDKFYCLNDINQARVAAEEMKILSREDSLARRSQVTLDNLFTQIEAGQVKELNIIIRADVQGSVDVLTKYLSELSTDEVKIKILHAAPGGITEGDVVLAEASNAIIIGFHVVPDEYASRTADANGVDIRLYNVIYQITDDLRNSMAGLLEPEEKEQVIGRAAVRETFKVSRIGTIAGCYVNDGFIRKNAKARLIRDNIVIQDQLEIESLKRFKDDVREVKAGMECGIKTAKFNDIKIGDIFDFYEVIEVARKL